MDQNFFTQNPAFQNISPEKLAFLMNFMNQEKPDSSRDMMTFLMSFVTKARNQNLSFTTDETDFIIQHLRQGLNPAEQVDLLKYHAQGTAQICFFDSSDIQSVISDRTFLNIVKTVNQVGNRCFSGTGRTYKGKLLTRLCKKTDIL